MKKIRSLLGLLLALAMLLSLAACGKKESAPDGKTNDKEEEERPEMVYKADTLEIKDERLTDGVNPVVYTDDGFYGLSYGKIADGEIPEGVVPEYEGQYDIYGYRIFQVGLDGSVKLLENYTPLPPQEDPGDKTAFYSGNSLMTLLDDGNGGLIAVESIYTGWFDGTEAEMNRGGDDSWDKYRYTNEYYIRHLNADGSEKETQKLDFDSQDTWLDFSTCVRTDDGNLVLTGDQMVLAFAPDGSLLFQVNSDFYVDRLIKLRDGSVMAVAFTERGNGLYPIDLENKRLGDPISIPNEAYNPLTGDENYDFYYVNGMYLYGYNIENEENTRILNWMDVDVNGETIGGLHIYPDGRIVGVTNRWRNETIETEIITLSLVPSSSIPEKEVLTLAVLYAYDVYDKVVEFNRHNDKVRIQILDYSEDNDYENEVFDAGYNKLLTEIMSGQVPDIILMSQLPYSQLAAKGLLEDLYPYIDKDPELKREDFFPNVLKALEVDGGLYQITPSFNVQTLIGATAVVGDTPGWNYDELRAALATMPAGCDPMDMYTTRSDMLGTLLAADLDHYVDWNTGTCNFESQDFIEMLEFAAQFPAAIPDNMEWENTSTRIAQGRQMLTAASLYSVDAMLWNEVQFGPQGGTYIGYPTNNGVGSYMTIDSGYAISASCKNKDAAWEFVRSFLTEEGQQDVWGIPVRLDAYQRQLDKAMEVEYEKDAEGNYRLGPDGQRIQVSRGGFALEDGTVYEVYAMTQEQADKLWEAVTTCDKLYNFNTEILEIVMNQAEAYFCGDKSAEEVARLIQSKVTLYINERR